MNDVSPGQEPGDINANPVPPKDFRADELSDELKASLDWLRQLSGVGSAYSRLFALELRLALGDGGRLLAVGLLMIPVALLAWIGLGVLLAWLVYGYSQSATLALAAFLLLQVATLVVMALACRRYAKSLSLPVTRRHLNALLEEARDEPSPTEH